MRRYVPGLALCISIATVAQVIANAEDALLGRPVIEALVLALLFGVFARSVPPLQMMRVDGIRLASKQFLEIAVVLLGLSIDMRQVLGGGPFLVAVILAGMGASFAVAFFVSRALGLSSPLASLIAIGNSVCGNSAIVALAPIVKANSEEIANAIGLTAVLGLALVLALPIIGAVAGLSQYEYGVMTGMTVYAVPQVLAAAAFGGTGAIGVALVVKLVRVTMLAPIVVVASLIVRSPGDPTRPNLIRYVPWFVWGFAALAAVRAADLVSAPIVELVRSIGIALTVVSMAGLGWNVDPASLRKHGPRVGVAVSSSLFALVAVALLLVRFLPKA
jgi:uncharacterized integral membrane protein (TIGR00698 family)